jgi:NADH dehydrogenase (ubiquinone) Fe-S protein 8
MAATRSVARLVAYRRPTPFGLLGSTANFSSSASRAATPAGAPPAGFRLPAPKRWDQDPESSLDKGSKYFLMAEIFRGMYVVLEQFFRPP